MKIEEKLGSWSRCHSEGCTMLFILGVRTVMLIRAYQDQVLTIHDGIRNEMFSPVIIGFVCAFNNYVGPDAFCKLSD